MFETIYKWANRVALGAAWAGGAMMIFASVMVTVDVLIRKIFNVTLGGADEISGYLFAIATSWALPYCLLHRANVRIDALYVHLPQVMRSVLDILGTTLLAIFAIVLTWRGLALLQDSIAIGALSVTPLHVPLPLPQSFWIAGWVLFSLCLVLVIAGMVMALIRGDLLGVHRLGGALSVEEEMDEEGITAHREHQKRNQG